jgi:hypothetical protein
VLAATISFSDGGYAFSLPTTGAALPAVLVYSITGYWATWVVSDRPYDVDIAGPNMGRWRLGDGPLWDDGAMGSVYSTLGATIDPSFGTLSVTARTCDGGTVEGVTFEIDPPPATAGYLDGSGQPSTVATSTMLPYTQWIAFNVAPGPTHIRATKAGVQFLELDVTVLSGSNMTYTVVHAIE